jgi:hypothetical protein
LILAESLSMLYFCSWFVSIASSVFSIYSV